MKLEDRAKEISELSLDDLLTEDKVIIITSYVDSAIRQGQIDVLLEMCNLLALTGICNVPEYEGCDVCPIWKKLDKLQLSDKQ